MAVNKPVGDSARKGAVLLLMICPGAARLPLQR